MAILSLGLLGLVLASTFVLLRNANSLSNLLEYPVWLVTGLLVSLSLLPGLDAADLVGARADLGHPRDAGGGARRKPGRPASRLCIALGLLYLVIGHFTLGYFEVRARRSATLALR